MLFGVVSQLIYGEGLRTGGGYLLEKHIQKAYRKGGINFFLDAFRDGITEGVEGEIELRHVQVTGHSVLHKSHTTESLIEVVISNHPSDWPQEEGLHDANFQ